MWVTIAMREPAVKVVVMMMLLLEAQFIKKPALLVEPVG